MYTRRFCVCLAKAFVIDRGGLINLFLQMRRAIFEGDLLTIHISWSASLNYTIHKGQAERYYSRFLQGLHVCTDWFTKPQR
jgi:hypothetical protein